MKVLCFALFAASFNLLLGYTAYCPSAMPPSSAARVLCHGPCGEGLGISARARPPRRRRGRGAPRLLIGFLAIRRQGIYFSMITLALSQMFFFFCLQAPFTGGEDGLQGVPRGLGLGLFDLSQPLAIYFYVLAVVLLGLFAIWRIVHSPFGMILKSIRENETRATSLGLSVGSYKLAAFVMSAGLAGLAGGLKALVFQFATLTDVSWQMSGEVILMTLLGGIGTMAGRWSARARLVSLQNYLATSAFPVTVVTGLTFMVCVLLFRRGIVGEIAHRLKRRA